MRVYLIAVVFSCLAVSLAAQAAQSGTFSLKVQPKVHEKELVSGQTYALENQEIQVKTLRFYLSGIVFLQEGREVYKEKSSYHLVDLEQPGSLSLNFELPPGSKVDEIQLILGIDSLTNVSGAFGGDLDPIKGMYWAWNSGYINFKLEGTSPQSSARAQKFQFHLGGYLPPYASARSLSFPIQESHELSLLLDIGQFLDQIDLGTQHTVMSPGPGGVALSELLPPCISIDE